MQIQSLSGTWQFRDTQTDQWLPATVPGSVHTDLLALDRIPDPFVADNELHVQWVAERDWEYRLLFEPTPALLAEEHLVLVCDGLDTLADVTLNGQRLGHAENMFRRYPWRVAGLLTGGENELRITFASPVAYIRQRQAEQPLNSVTQGIPGGPYLRKAPCQFGWDWGPQLPPLGIWKDIRVEGHSTARLKDVHLRQRHIDNNVTVGTQVVIDRWQETSLEIIMRMTAPNGHTQAVQTTLPGHSAIGQLNIVVENPQRWWPNGYGPQPLYQVEVELYQGNNLCDKRNFQLGLRTLELRQEPDSFGTSFTFVINGVPIFAKGANWIPADSFPTRITDEHLEHLIRSSAQTHMNMLRVWGGGFYEEERFYDLCDRYGILVWQDFIFSCSVYPDDETFVTNVRAEAIENIRRLRHRASLALWCGNNEMEWQSRWTAQDDRQRYRAAYDRIFHNVLPELCVTEDPDHAYWPSSPSSNTLFENANGQERGDAHYWDVWHARKPFTAYRDQYPRFMSEFGFQSLPPLATIKTFANEKQWNITSYTLEHHQRHATGNSLIIAQMTESFRLPKDFPALVYLSMVLQAEGIRYGVEHWRRHKNRVSGTLYWQLNDCWPAASWSSIDYFGRWKALHYAARRFYAPVLLAAEEQGATINLHLTNDFTEEWRGAVLWSLETLSGEVLASGQQAASAPGLGSVRVCRLDFSNQVSAGPSNTIKPNLRRDIVLAYELWQEDNRLSLDVVPFVPNKHLQLVDADIHYVVRQTEQGFNIDLTTGQLARFVELSLADTDVIFSNNYFDLPAGRMVTVGIPSLEGWTIAKVQEALSIRSLADTY
jgi:beta-mannosidase